MNNTTTPNKDKPIVIGSGTESVLYCDICSRKLIPLKGGQYYECGYCGIKITPDNLNVKKGRMINTREGFISAVVDPQAEEPAVSTTPGIPDISIRHEKELRGGFKALSEKGTIRFISYNTTEKQ